MFEIIEVLFKNTEVLIKSAIKLVLVSQVYLTPAVRAESLETGLMLWYNLRNGKGI
jgi:hypothetical protein